MKANELMIGDWVKIKTYGVSDQFERTEAYIYVKIAEIGSGLITVDYNNDIKEPYRICENTEIEPTPLTSEILDKNGFKQLEEDSYICKKSDEEDDYSIVVDLLVPYLSYIRKDKMPKACYGGEIKFVHQLQNALRLCGISKEIEL